MIIFDKDGEMVILGDTLDIDERYKEINIRSFFSKENENNATSDLIRMELSAN